MGAARDAGIDPIASSHRLVPAIGKAIQKAPRGKHVASLCSAASTLDKAIGHSLVPIVQKTLATNTYPDLRHAGWRLLTLVDDTISLHQRTRQFAGGQHDDAVYGGILCGLRERALTRDDLRPFGAHLLHDLSPSVGLSSRITRMAMACRSDSPLLRDAVLAHTGATRHDGVNSMEWREEISDVCRWLDDVKPQDPRFVAWAMATAQQQQSHADVADAIYISLAQLTAQLARQGTP